jgi:RES domain-containing protein
LIEPVIVWRISNDADLTGIGGRLASARWHSIGRPIVYTSEHPALAMLETLVHLDRSDFPSRFQLLTIELPDGSVSALSAAMPADAGRHEAWSRRMGDEWLAEKSSLAMRVPSVVAPYSWNCLINPAHPRMSEARIARIDQMPLDIRLK